MMRSVNLVIAGALAIVLSGCIGGYQLVKYGGDQDLSTGWVVYQTPRPATTELEHAVLTVASTKKNASFKNSQVYFVVEDSSAKYVDVVNADEDVDPFTEREVVRYRIVDGSIAARTRPTREIFPSVAFERAVLEIAAMGNEPNVLMRYDGLGVPVTLTVIPQTACKATVRVFGGGTSGKGEMLAEKTVNGCFALSQSIE